MEKQQGSVETSAGSNRNSILELLGEILEGEVSGKGGTVIKNYIEHVGNFFGGAWGGGGGG